MAAAGAISLLVAIGSVLVAAEGGPVARGYAVAAAVLVALLALRQVERWLPAPPAAPPLHRLAPRRRATEAVRPGALLDWEAALFAMRVHGSAARTVGRRLAPLVAARLRERTGAGTDGARALDVLGPAWARLRPDGPAGRGAPGPSLDDVDEVTRRLEAL